MTDLQMHKMNAVAVVSWASKLSILSCVCICMDECLIGSDGRWKGARWAVARVYKERLAN